MPCITSSNNIEGSETGLEQLRLTDNMDDLSVNMETSKHSKYCICVSLNFILLNK